MQFRHTPERSTELLRLALPLMSRQAAALHPKSYALWYAYVADGRSPLRQEVDRVLSERGRLDERDTEALFARHLAPLAPEGGLRMADSLHQVIGAVAVDTARADDQARRYGHALEQAASMLALEQSVVAADAAGQPMPLVAELLAQTQQMVKHMAELQQRLAESQQEIAQLRLDVERARQDSLVDTLTGLANRRALGEALGRCLSDAGGEPGRCSLLLADLDHFKRINDTYGHGFGDQVLQAVAHRLRAMAPAQALVARYGGEEFALLLPGVALADAVALAERVRAAVAAGMVRRKGEQQGGERVTISVGAAARRAGEPAAALLERADRALYAAKSDGRDRVVVDD